MITMVETMPLLFATLGSGHAVYWDSTGAFLDNAGLFYLFILPIKHIQ